MKVWFILPVSVFLIFSSFTLGNTAPPDTLTYQGRLTDSNGAVLTDPVTLVFRLYSQESGGTALWMETLLNIEVQAGYFSAVLGETTSLSEVPFDEPYWLSLEVNGDGEMGQRMKLTSVPYAFSAGSNSSTSEEEAPENYSNTLGMSFKLIPAGTFTMGCTVDDSLSPCGAGESPKHDVTISQPFYMATTEVTQGQWEEVMGQKMFGFESCGSNCPADSISWEDTQTFITAINNLGEGTYRLPTEAEWEYAARAGTTTAMWFGNSESLAGASAWYGSNSSNTTNPVAQKTPNAWGLYDIHGNVWEWVLDWYDADYYSSSPSSDPMGATSGSERISRGGGWSVSVYGLRVAYRNPNASNSPYDNHGFRLVRVP
jgi:formylglycine-generating enzyme required for sulfatase activity